MALVPFSSGKYGAAMRMGRINLVTKVYSEVLRSIANAAAGWDFTAPDAPTVRIKVDQNSARGSAARIYLYSGRVVLGDIDGCDFRYTKSVSILFLNFNDEKLLAVIFVFINSVISTTGYAGVMLLMAIESACIPLPSELIMPFAGYLVFTGTFKLLWVATAGAIGCNLGSLVAYEIGCYGGRPLVERYGSWILMGRRELDWADRFFLRWVIWQFSSGGCCR